MNPKIWSYSTLILIIISIFKLPGYSQGIGDVKADSLRIEIENKSGTEKIASKLDLALLIIEKNKEEALELARAALEDAQKDGNQNLEIRSYYVLGRIMVVFDKISLSQAYYDSALHITNVIEDDSYKGEILYRKGMNHYRNKENLKALETFNEALKACQLTGNFKIMGSTYSMLGTIFRLNGIYDRAIEYIIKSKLNYEKAGFIEGDAWVTYLLGRIYADLKTPQKALAYFYESLNIYEKLASVDGSKNGLAICNEQISLLELELKNYDVARATVDKVMKIHTEGNSKYGISNALTIYGRIEYYTKNYTLAEDYLNQSLVIKKEINSVLGLPVIYEYLGLCHIARGQVNKGFEELLLGLDHSIRNNQKRIQLDIYAKLTEAYKNLNNLEKALFYQNKHIEIQDKIVSGTANIKMEQFQAFYEIEEKNKQILELEKQNEINSLRIKQNRTYQIIMIIGILLALLISIIVYFFYKKIRQKNRELKVVNDTKDKLFSIVSHDLKGSIGSVLGLSEILVSEIETKNISSFKNHFQLMHKSLYETFDLLTNLLEWAYSQIKGIKFNPEVLSLNNVVSSALLPIADQAEKKNIAMKVDISENVYISADLNMLKTILRNLISNAIKFTNENGNVVICAFQKGDTTKVCIKDNGIGISSDMQNNLFSLNENTTKIGTAGEKGTGLGLILCKDFVEIHRGKIWVESNPDKGSSFYFTLPAQS